MNNSRIKFRVQRILYPKGNMLNLGEYSIVACSVIETIEGEKLQLNKDYHNFSLLSNTPVIFNFYDEYDAEVKPKETKYGISYELVKLFQNNREMTSGAKRSFLETVLTPNQVENLYFAYDDPYELIVKKDTDSLLKVKGLGEKTVKLLYKKFNENLKYEKIIVELNEYHLTKAIMDNLLNQYGDADTVIAKVKENIYVLADEVKGIGFIKADKLAMQKGIAPNSQYRIQAFMKYCLKKEAEDGNSWVWAQPFLKNLSSNLGVKLTNEEIKEALHSLYDKKVLWWDDKKTRLALCYSYRLEHRINDELLRLKNCKTPIYTQNSEQEKKIIKQTENDMGITLTDEQITAVNTIMSNNVTVLTAAAGCVDADTEFFNGRKWKKISDYHNGDKVLQYDTKTGKSSLISPLRYIKAPCDIMYLIKSKYGVNQCLSPDHRVLYCRPDLKDNTIKEVLAEDMAWKHFASSSGFKGKIPVTFNYNGVGIPLSDTEIKIMCAVICDGTFSSNTSRCRFHIKKERKKEKLRELFTEAQIEWKEHTSSACGYTDFYIYAPRREKEFLPYWYNCNSHQLQVICDNILFWDGCVSSTKSGNYRKKFSTTVKQTADFIQFAFSATGHKASLKTNDRRGKIKTNGNKTYTTKSIDYDVLICDRKFVSIGGFSPTNKDYKNSIITEMFTTDGYKYCFTVPTGALVLRREGQIFITGNCGKTVLTKAIGEIYKKNNKSVCFCTLSGKAAARIEEATGFKGATIHRTLKYEPQNESFFYNENNQLPYSCVIVDESSFLGGELFLSLIKAIPSGAKLVLVGDDKQLPAIGGCNIFFDIINSHKIPVARLTKIHRQAQKSGIIVASKEIREGRQITKKGWNGYEIRGELKDFLIDVYDDRIVSYPKLMDYYKHYVKTLQDADKTQIILATKSKGDCNTFDVNNDIQEYLNPPSPFKNEILLQRNGKQFVLRKGDKVINRKNDYKAEIYLTDKEKFDLLGEDPPTAEIFNGFCGYVEDIIDNKVIVKFDLVESKIVFSYDTLKNLELAYALTVHLFQGSQVDRIIYLIDNSSFIMNTRELLYTAITRAKKECVLLAQEQALNHAIATSQTIKKQTFLKEFLIENA